MGIMIVKIFFVSLFIMLFGFYCIGIQEKKNPGWIDDKIFHVIVYVSYGIAIISSLIL